MVNPLKKTWNWLKRDWSQPVNRTFIRAEIALGVSVFLGMFFYYNGQSLANAGQLLDLRLAITLAIVEVPLLMLTPILYRAILDESRQKEVREEKKEHKESFYDIMDKIPVLPSIDWRTQEISKFWWCDHGGYPLFPFLQSHLEKYELGRLYQKCRKYYDDKTNEMEQKVREFNDYVEKKIEPFTDLPNLNDYDAGTQVYMIKNRIKKGIFSIISSQIRDNISVVPPQYSTGTNSFLMLSGYGCAQGEEKIIKKLADMITPLLVDEKLRSTTRELINMIKEMDEQPKNIFDEGRKRLLLTLREGHKNLEGKCILCPR